MIAMQVCAVNCAMTSLTKTLGTFAQERVIVGRELSKGSYRAGAYFLAKLAAEAPVSALFPAMYGIIIYLSCGLYPSASRCAPAACCFMGCTQHQLHRQAAPCTCCCCCCCLHCFAGCCIAQITARLLHMSHSRHSFTVLVKHWLLHASYQCTQLAS